MTSTNRGGVGRREFLRLTGQGGLALSLAVLGDAVSPAFLRGALAGMPAFDYASWEDIYRKQWTWDKVSWGTHNNQCNPASCSFRVYSRNGVIWRAEQTGHARAASADYPDFNPMGCQKGCGFHQLLYSPERVQYPMKRVGTRGEGRWRRITWDEAITQVADSILDGHQRAGPATFVIDAPHVHAGAVALGGSSRLGHMLAATTQSTNVAIGDDLKGIAHVYGTMKVGMSTDNMFDAELIVCTNSNWSYTAPPLYHFITEARYNGAEVVVLAPDYNPTTVHADIHIPLRASTDAAFWLGVCQVLIAEKIFDAAFVAEQTDLPLLVRADNGRFLSAADIDGGKPNQLYYFDGRTGAPAKAPRGTLTLDGQPVLGGQWTVMLKDGARVAVETVFSRVRRMVNEDYTPEKAGRICGLAPSVIVGMARKMAVKRTHLNIGFTSAKHYHGDLMERAALLACGLTGNWGKPGTGASNFLFPTDHLEYFAGLETPVQAGGMDKMLAAEQQFGAYLRHLDPDVTDADIRFALQERGTIAEGTTPPAIWLYQQAGFNKLWDNPKWRDPALKRSFGEYLQAAQDEKRLHPNFFALKPETAPEVILTFANNPLRRVRSGRSQYVDVLYPKVKLLVSLETRMSTTAAYADIVLPAAWWHEKDDMSQTFVYSPFQSLNQKAVEPVGEAKPEWEVFSLIAAKIGERAAARGLNGFVDRGGVARAYADLPGRFTMNGAMATNADVMDQFVRICERKGLFPKGFTYDTFKEVGSVRLAGLGNTIASSDWREDKPFYSFGQHLRDKKPYSTFTRRAQFYMDHDWFIEAGEQLPVHKEMPPIGGQHPFHLISGHPRISVHTIHQASPPFMRLHRAQPVVFVNPQVAARKGINDGDMVRIFNDVDSSELMASLSAAVGPDQVVIYMFEPFQFKNWKSHDNMLVGFPKPTHMATDYPNLRYTGVQGTSAPSTDRNLRVDLVKV